MKTTLKYYLLSMIITTLMINVMNSQELDRTKRPSGKNAPALKLPQIQKAQLSNGLQVWLVERHQLPLVAFNLVLYAGSDQDPLNQPGLTSMTADVLDEGTNSRDALQISEEIESIGASFGVGSSWMDHFSLLTVFQNLWRRDWMYLPTFCLILYSLKRNLNVCRSSA